MTGPVMLGPDAFAAVLSAILDPAEPAFISLDDACAAADAFGPDAPPPSAPPQPPTGAIVGPAAARSARATWAA